MFLYGFIESHVRTTQNQNEPTKTKPFTQIPRACFNFILFLLQLINKQKFLKKSKNSPVVTMTIINAFSSVALEFSSGLISTGTAADDFSSAFSDFFYCFNL